jgi:rare lipoprotein A
MIKKITLTIISLFISILILKAKDKIGLASYYANSFEGKLTSNGEIFTNSKLTCASNFYKIGTKLKVTNLRTNKFVYVRVNDTGILYGIQLDLSQKAFNTIGKLSRGIIKVRIEKIEQLNYKLNYKFYVRARENCSLYK